ncbi:MAG: hypothetical protein V1720_06205 [bacterium]
MKRFNKTLTVLFGFFLTVVFFYGCQQDEGPADPGTTSGSDTEALEKLVAEDESLDSFEPNYNEEDVMNMIGLNKVNTEIYPVRVGQRMLLVSKNLTIDFDGDSAFGKLTRTFQGYLMIAASYEPFEHVDSTTVDTVITKPFTTTVEQNIIFKKVGNTPNPELNWRIWRISLPEGGTGSIDVRITKMTIYLPDGEIIEVDSPLDYYLSRHAGLDGQIPVLSPGETVSVRIEAKSGYAEADFVTLTYGAFRNGLHRRAKTRFEMTSESFDGVFYNRVFEADFTVMYPGWKHAIINMLPHQTLTDDAAAVEESSWAIPYVVR